jgi:glycine/D-amino acid oxidase-like deaminating enzyme
LIEIINLYLYNLIKNKRKMKVAVVGSGIWGACSAYQLNKAGVDVELYDMWGAGNSRSGSGGASRIIRLAYGDDKIYTELTNN